MIPSAWIHLDSFPRTPNGKVDRKALPNLPEKATKRTVNTPSDFKQLIFHTWKKVLGIESIGWEDNFFDLGGDSFGIAKVQTAITKELGLKIPVTVFLQYPTITQLSKYLSQQESPEKPDSRDSKRKLALQQFKMRAER